MPAEQREREAPVWNAQKAISSMDAEMRDVPGAGGARELRSAAVENKAGYDVGSGDHQPSRLRAEPLRMRDSRTRTESGEEARVDTSEAEEIHKSKEPVELERHEGRETETSQVKMAAREILGQMRVVEEPTARKTGPTREANRQAGDEGERVEIQISIGTVELRAPRPAPQVLPAAPAFRPLVTLEDYLKRGAGAGGRGGRS
jgi:hypothetical protein